jgi:hypothetical protein
MEEYMSTAEMRAEILNIVIKLISMEDRMNLSRRHKLRKGDQWYSIGWRFEDDDGWRDVESKYYGQTVASVDPNNLYLFRRKVCETSQKGSCW